MTSSALQKRRPMHISRVLPRPKEPGFSLSFSATCVSVAGQASLPVLSLSRAQRSSFAASPMSRLEEFVPFLSLMASMMNLSSVELGKFIIVASLPHVASPLLAAKASIVSMSQSASVVIRAVFTHFRVCDALAHFEALQSDYSPTPIAWKHGRRTRCVRHSVDFLCCVCRQIV